MSHADPVNELVQILCASTRTVALTGAGMSTESGIPDFRSPTGIYAQGISEDVFDIRTFQSDPARFYRNIRGLVASAWDAEPNAGHQALSDLAGDVGKHVEVITQNIDTLHQRAGSPIVHAVHGTMESFTCRKCGGHVDGTPVWEEVIRGTDLPRHEGCNGVLKPDIVFFGEALPEKTLLAAQQAVENADAVIVAGSSLSVYPAAMLPAYRPDNSSLIVVNQTATAADDAAGLIVRASVGKTLAATVAAVKSCLQRRLSCNSSQCSTSK